MTFSIREFIFKDKNQKDFKMAESIQVKLPPEMTKIFADIKVERAAKFEPLSNVSIVIDAVKAMHSKIKEQQ